MFIAHHRYCIALAFAVSYAALAADSTNSAVDGKVEQQKQDQTAQKRQQITAEAIAAVSETRNALKALDDGKKDDAIAALERASGKPSSKPACLNWLAGFVSMYLLIGRKENELCQFRTIESYPSRRTLPLHALTRDGTGSKGA